jgi:hypothetical protein
MAALQSRFCTVAGNRELRPESKAPALVSHMPPIARHSWIPIAAVAAIGLILAVILLLFSGNQSPTPSPLRIDRQQLGNAGSSGVALSTNVLPDFFRQKYSPAQKAEFRVTCSQPIAIAVWATGVQVHTESGWAPFSEEPRNETWRLTPGTERELVVERPPTASRQIWRAYVRYGTEMRAPPLLQAQLREAWRIRSFSNWTGKAWGGGRFSGSHDLFSKDCTE